MEKIVAPGGLNVENMKLWVDALLSDKYKQGHGRLAYCDRNPETGELGPKKMCCLGLVSEIAIAHGVDVNVTEDVGAIRVGYTYNGLRDFLDYTVMKWLGVDSTNPELLIDLPDGTQGFRTASSLNDGEAFDGQEKEEGSEVAYLPPYTFRQIALALIRTYSLPGYEHLLGEANDKTD